MSYQRKTKKALWVKDVPAVDRKALDKKLYRQAVESFRKDPKNCRCHICHRTSKTAKLENHHLRGRRGMLLFEQRHFITLCRKCHRWVHDNMQKADALGYIHLSKWGQNDCQ